MGGIPGWVTRGSYRALHRHPGRRARRRIRAYRIPGTGRYPVKAGLGKLDVDANVLVGEIGAGGFSELPVRAVHAALVRDLPEIHRDPFDRMFVMFVAQAPSEPLGLVTADGQLSKYTDLVIEI
ncbi:type II toxin-antitoxin system VapC family toxin [Paraburkholderia sp. J8-2]|uniref:type II toxin-antitoxin system VapC family toxin n=1 Tax=Paraburkholderia sp. J8-2 TaxID=2805440 RepID=UPI002AB7E93A|nr:type II toxin-antitoxin system VapC family toxin [Paraburkholderia sp. J8-2]